MSFPGGAVLARRARLAVLAAGMKWRSARGLRQILGRELDAHGLGEGMPSQPRDQVHHAVEEQLKPVAQAADAIGRVRDISS